MSAAPDSLHIVLPPAPSVNAIYTPRRGGGLQRLSHAGLIPCRNINPGGKNAVYRYSPAALDQWLAGDDQGTEPKVLPSRSHHRRRVRECT